MQIRASGWPVGICGSRDSGSEPETYRSTLACGGLVLPKNVSFADVAQPAAIMASRKSQANPVKRDEECDILPPPKPTLRAGLSSRAELNLALTFERGKVLFFFISPLHLAWRLLALQLSKHRFGLLSGRIKTIGRVNQKICIALFLFLRHLGSDSLFRFLARKTVTGHQTLQLHFRPAMNND